MMEQYVLGADIGGTHITTTIVDILNKTVLEKSYVRKHVDSSGSLEQIIAEWKNAIFNSFHNVGMQPTKIGIAMPGPFDYEKGISLIKENKYESLYQVNVKDLLADNLGIKNTDILLANDAQCFLSGETFLGVARNYNKVIGITLGTGLGSATFDNGKVKDAELWCMPFRDGIAEEYLSTRWFLKRYFELSGINALNVKDLANQFSQSASVQQLFKEFAHTLGEFILEFAPKINPEAIVLGGNISKAHNLFLSILIKFLRNENLHIPVFISELNESAAIIGAASLFHYK
jgi:glucokinase